MTPKEKAKELIKKLEEVSIMCDTRTLDKEDAKRCALICVDECQKLDESMNGLNYWDSVKQEIKKN